MAGTYNSKTGYLTINGIDVLAGGVIKVDQMQANATGAVFVNDSFAALGATFDSDVIVRAPFTTYGANTYVSTSRFLGDSTFSAGIIADGGISIKTNHGYHNLDSEWVISLVTPLISDDIDSDVIDQIAIAAQAQLTVNVNNLDSDVSYNQMRIIIHDSDIQNLKGKYSTILSNDSVQDANIATNTADILTLSNRISQNDSDITEIETDVTALYGRMTTNENTNTTLDARVSTLEATVGVTGTGGHDDRITTLEADLAALQATIAALTIGDLTDTDLTTTPPAVGDVLEWNGTDWVPVATS